MPRKPRIPKSSGPSAMSGLPALREMVPINRLRLEIEQEGSTRLRFNGLRYRIQDAVKLSHEIIYILLEISPIVVVKQDGLNYDVLAGSRMFSIVANNLDQSTQIPVLVIDRRYAHENEGLLRYLDLAVLPLLHTLISRAHVLYRLFNVEGPRRKTWLPPLDSKPSSFADVLRVSLSALCEPKRHGREKDQVQGKPSYSEESGESSQ